MIFYLFEIERPNNYKQLPRYARKDYWYAMYRAVKVHSDDVVDIVHFHSHRARVLGFMLLLVTLTYNVFGPIYSYGSWQAFAEEVRDEHQYVFNFEELTRREYRTGPGSYVRDTYTEDEWVERQTRGESGIHTYRFFNRLAFLYFMWSHSLIMLGIWLCWPKHCPIRLDRKNELIYTWHKGHFYVADVGPQVSGLRGRVVSEADENPLYKIDKSTGAYSIDMHRADGKGKNNNAPIPMLLAPYPPCHSHQSEDIGMFIQAFMHQNLFDENERAIAWHGEWLNKIQKGRRFKLDAIRWLGKHSLGRSTHFDQTNVKAKTDAALMEYLTHPDTRNRGGSVWAHKAKQYEETKQRNGKS
ncbi:hypothetical protein PN836_002700 [Ningiella sp. W23]|uniref:hypothetical protein n=1 Tax=Ningiella sp. W23 TaxID=3023715 RepID=UPI0037580662